MNRQRKLRWQNLFVLLAALACAGAWAVAKVDSIHDKAEADQITKKMKTVCVGRFLVDIPVDAELSFSGERMDGFKIDTIEESAAEFHTRMAARENDIALRATEADAHGPGGIVEARDLHVPGMVGRVLVFGRTRTYGLEEGRRVDVEWVTIEAHAHLGGLSFSLSMDYADESDALAAERLLAHLKLRSENEIPSELGFCIGRAVFAEPLPPHKTEHITMHLGFLAHPDVALALAILPGGGRDRTLLMRYADMDAETSFGELLRVNKLRMGKRDINGIPGQEVLEQVHEYNFATTYGFMWETQGVKDNPLQPFMSLELHGGINSQPGGKPIDTSLHRDAVLALWQQISSTIHLRGGKQAQTVRADSTNVKRKHGVACTASDRNTLRAMIDHLVCRSIEHPVVTLGQTLP